MNGMIAKAAFGSVKKKVEKAFQTILNNPGYRVISFEIHGSCPDKEVEITAVKVLGNDGIKRNTKI